MWVRTLSMDQLVMVAERIEDVLADRELEIRGRLQAGSCVYSCLFTVVKEHRTLLPLVQATHQIMQLALHRLVASLFSM